VLFLDEPTAGLDPRTETLMMMLFRQLANQGSTIIITTHLLGSFGVLDKVVVLVQGRLAYYGPGTKFLEYFKAESPPDVYDDLTDNNTIPYALELKQKFQNAPLYEKLVVEPQREIPAEHAPAAGHRGPVQSGQKKFSLRQFATLLQRTWQLKFGDRAQTILLFGQAPLVALLVALMSGTSNQVQTIFMAMFSSLWFGCSNAVREIVDEQTIYRRERQTGLKIPSYILSKLTVLSVVALVQCFSVVVICSFVKRAFDLSLPEACTAILIMFLVAVNGSLIGLLISSLVSTPEKALTIFPLVLIPELLLSGLFLPVKPIQTIVPVPMGQLYVESTRHAEPEATALVERFVQPCEGVPYAVYGAKPTAANGEGNPSAADQTATTEAEEGKLGHQVGAGLVLSGNVANCFHRFTPAADAGMGRFIQPLSALAISRWGLEALSDVCVHGGHSTGDAAYKILNTVAISLHPNDVPSLLKGLDGPPDYRAHDQPPLDGQPRPQVDTSLALPLEAHFLSDKGPYLAILAGYAVLMLVLVLIVMKRKDVK